MKKFIFILMFLLVPNIVYAVTLSWTNPTTFTDNTTITAEYLTYAFLRVYVCDTDNTSTCSRFPDSNYTPNYPTTQHVFDTVNPAVLGKWYTLKFVVPCNPALPMTSNTGGDAVNNKCPSDFAVPEQYVGQPSMILKPPVLNSVTGP